MKFQLILLFLVCCCLSFGDVSGIYKKESAATVKISDMDGGHGSGVQIYNGMILTVEHVVEDYDNFTVVFQDGKTFHATEYYLLDKIHDLAVIKIDQNKEPCLKINRKQALIGSDIFIVGYPLFLNAVFSKGMITSYVPDPWDHTVECYLFDAAINPGNSGGPIVNSHCELIGLVDAILQDTDSLNLGQEINNLPKDIFKYKSQLFTKVSPKKDDEDWELVR